MSSFSTPPSPLLLKRRRLDAACMASSHRSTTGASLGTNDSGNNLGDDALSSGCLEDSDWACADPEIPPSRPPLVGPGIGLLPMDPLTPPAHLSSERCRLGSSDTALVVRRGIPPPSTPPAPTMLVSEHCRRLDSVAPGRSSVIETPPCLNGALSFEDVEQHATSVDVNFSPSAAISQPATPPRPGPSGSSSLPATGTFESPPKLTPRTKRSYAILEADSHTLRQDILNQERADKTTKRMYERGLKSYCEWFEQDQVRTVANDSSLVPLPAIPITANKVAKFLKHEMTREKKKVSITWPFIFPPQC